MEEVKGGLGDAVESEMGLWKLIHMDWVSEGKV